MKTVKALVAVRSGSIRIENKNIRPFAGTTLLELKINQLKRISLLDGIVVNSNCDEMLMLADSLGCECVKRDSKYASNKISMSEVYRNLAENFSGDTVVYVNVTNPLLQDQTIERAISQYQAFLDTFDSLNSAHLIKEFLFQNNLPINYDLRYQPRSQDLPDIAALNFGINIISKEKMIDCKNVVGYKPNIFLIDEIEAIDIDNPIDFDFAEFVYSKKYIKGNI